MTTKRTPRTGTSPKADPAAALDGFSNPRFDEIVALIARNAAAVAEALFGGDRRTEESVEQSRGRGLDRSAAPPCPAFANVRFDLQKPIVQSLQKHGSYATKTERIGFADIEISFDAAALPGGMERWYLDDKRARLLLFCRPAMTSMSETMRTIQVVRSRPNCDGHDNDRRWPHEFYGVATDNPAHRALFRNAGFLYLCTQGNQIDCWGDE